MGIIVSKKGGTTLKKGGGTDTLSHHVIFVHCPHPHPHNIIYVTSNLGTTCTRRTRAWICGLRPGCNVIAILMHCVMLANLLNNPRKYTTQMQNATNLRCLRTTDPWSQGITLYPLGDVCPGRGGSTRYTL